MNQPKADASEARPLGMAAIFGVLVGGGCLLFTVLGLINTAVDGRWVVQVSGADVELPDSYEVCAGLGAVGVLLIVLSLFGSFVRQKFQDAKGKPALRVAIIAVAFGLLVVVGRGLQILALTQTYGSMLAYYATDGDLDDVRAELAKGPSAEELDAAVSRAAQYDNWEALELLFEAGADLRDATAPEDRRICALSGVGLKFVEVALAHGVGPDSCPNSEALIWTVVNGSQPDLETAQIVKQLAAAGWSTTATPEFSEEPPSSVAKRLDKPLTFGVLDELAR